MTSATIAEKLLTADEFASLRDPIDGSQQELVRGVVVTMPPPKPVHGVCCGRIAWLLGSFVFPQRLGVVLTNDAGVVTESDPDTVRGPDVCYYSRARVPKVPAEGYFRIAPDLAVEVLSPSDRPKAVYEKVKEYLTLGTGMVWVVSPDDRTVTIYRIADQGIVLHAGSMLSGEDVLPGFATPVAELFES